MADIAPLPKHIDLMSDAERADWVRLLLDSQVPEGLLIDYKRGPYDLGSEGGKKELAKDVVSFANTQGGAVIVGIPETDGKPMPPYGIAREGDYECRVVDILSSTVRPFLPQLRICWVPLDDGTENGVYVLWHPESWSAPHMVAGYGEFRYFRRQADRSIPIPMTETEVAQLYERRLAGERQAHSFLANTEQFFHGRRAPGRAYMVAAICPRLLTEGMLDFGDAQFRDWLKWQPFRIGEGAYGGWAPSSLGATQFIQQEHVPQCTVIMHSNGSVSVAARLSKSATSPDRGVAIEYVTLLQILYGLYSITGAIYDHIGRTFAELAVAVHFVDVLDCHITVDGNEAGDHSVTDRHSLGDRLTAAEIIANTDAGLKPMLRQVWRSFAHTWEPPY